MTTPRIVSMTALVASLLIIVLTITQANGHMVAPGVAVGEPFCMETGGTGSCRTEPSVAFLTH